jgi:hypothetical protein
MVKCGVYFAVRTEFSNIINTRFGFKGLKAVFYRSWDADDLLNVRRPVIIRLSLVIR